MSTSSRAPEPQQGGRSVREEVKDGLAVICTSLGVSTAIAVALTLVAKLAG